MSEVTITAAELRRGDVLRLGGYPLTVAHDVHSPERTYIYLDHPGGSEDVLTAFPLSAPLTVERDVDPDAPVVADMAQAINRTDTTIPRHWAEELARAALAAYRTHEA